MIRSTLWFEIKTSNWAEKARPECSSELDHASLTRHHPQPLFCHR